MIRDMPTYEFRCRTCGDTFTQSRPMTDSSAPAACPNGHDDTRRLLAVAGVSRSREGASTAPSTGGGGCCGGSCGCG
jgi:putative FmdB family regulatory protein